MTATSTILATLTVFAALTTACSTSDPTPEATRPAEQSHPQAYLTDVHAHTTLTWGDDQLLAMGRQLCRNDYLSDFDEGEFFDSIGVLAPDRRPVQQAAHNHLC